MPTACIVCCWTFPPSSSSFSVRKNWNCNGVGSRDASARKRLTRCAHPLMFDSMFPTPPTPCGAVLACASLMTLCLLLVPVKARRPPTVPAHRRRRRPSSLEAPFSRPSLQDADRIEIMVGVLRDALWMSDRIVQVGNNILRVRCTRPCWCHVLGGAGTSVCVDSTVQYTPGS